jgi:hypothetical protein
VVDALVTTTDDFLSRDICLSATQLIGLFGTKRAYFQLGKAMYQGVFFGEIHLFLQLS